MPFLRIHTAHIWQVWSGGSQTQQQLCLLLSVCLAPECFPPNWTSTSLWGLHFSSWATSLHMRTGCLAYLHSSPTASEQWLVRVAEWNPTALTFANFMHQSSLWDQAETSPEINHIHASLHLLPYVVSLENLLNKPFAQSATSGSGLGSPPKAVSQWPLMADDRCLGWEATYNLGK